MRTRLASTPLAGLAAWLLLIPPASAQSGDPAAWKTAAELPGVDQSALTAAGKQTLLEMLRTESCNCGCALKIAECRVKDPRCGKSRSLAAIAARELQEGRPAEQVRAELDRRMREAPPLLDEPVPMAIDGAPAKGAANARITLVEFSDFQ